MPCKVVIAAAGSGKTEMIIQEALNSLDSTLILTYTNENLNVIKDRIIKSRGFLPAHIKLKSWYSFLLKEAVRPYQN
ncbi:ATP-dependent DNA helicase, partial [bacterium]